MKRISQTPARVGIRAPGTVGSLYLKAMGWPAMPSALVGSAWNTGKEAQVLVSGSWRPVSEVYVLYGSAWHLAAAVEA